MFLPNHVSAVLLNGQDDYSIGQPSEVCPIPSFKECGSIDWPAKHSRLWVICFSPEKGQAIVIFGPSAEIGLSDHRTIETSGRSLGLLEGDYSAIGSGQIWPWPDGSMAVMIGDINYPQGGIFGRKCDIYEWVGTLPESAIRDLQQMCGKGLIYSARNIHGFTM
jgi:hypothetical protein